MSSTTSAVVNAVIASFVAILTALAFTGTFGPAGTATALATALVLLVIVTVRVASERRELALAEPEESS
jgi:peptidoglycan biosynthesis protein MviN/MurJ (putative lipid II flippase)